MSSYAAFWPDNIDADEYLVAPAGAVVLLIVAYPAGADGVKSLDFEGAGWTEWFTGEVFDPFDSVVSHHISVASFVLDRPLDDNYGPFNIPVVPGGATPGAFSPNAGYMMLAFSNISDVQASSSYSVWDGSVDPALPAVAAPAGATGILFGAITSQSGLEGAPTGMTEVTEASWFSPPYNQLIIKSFVETNLPAGAFSRNWSDTYGLTMMALVVVS